MQFYLVRSGDFNIANSVGVLRIGGSDGRCWPSRGSAITSAYVLYFNPNTVIPSDGPTDRYYGHPSAALVLY